MVTNNNSSDPEHRSLLPEASKNRYQSTNIITTSSSSSSNHSSISNTNVDDNLFNNHQPLLTHHYGRGGEEEDHPHDVIPQHPQRVQQQDQPYNAAYEILEKANLLVTTFRKESFSDIFQEEDLNPNSSLAENFTKKWQWGVYWTPGCGWILYNPFLKQRGGPIGLYGTQNHRNIIEHGDRCVFVVPQGMIGYATDMGRPVLLPPGLHCWKSDTLRLERMFRLDDNMAVLQIGPYTILTVEEGMVAITVNHGRQVLLEGGRTHLLTHHKWKLERFVSVKIQSEDLRQVNVSTADNIVMNVDATCVWKIVDIEKAAIMLTESSTMMRSDISLGTLTDDENGGGAGAGLSKLRRDVLKETISAIARFVSEVNYTEYFHAVSSAMRSSILSDSDYEMSEMTAEVVQSTIENPMFRHGRLKQCVDDVNEITSEFGVEIINVSIITASPANASLMTSLSTSAIASAEALQAETHARGMARTMEIEAQAEAKALLTKAKADAEAEVLRSQSAKDAELLRAQGVKEAAKLIESSPLAVTLETIKASAMAIKDSDKFFFGQHPDYMPNLMRSDNH